MKTAAPQRSSLILLSVLSAAALFGQAFMLYGVYAMSRKSAEESAEITRAIEGQSRALAMNNFLRSTEGARASLAGHFVTDDSIVSFIERLEALADEAGISFSLSIVDPPANEPVLDVSFRVGGTFENLEYFLSLLEALPLELDVTRFAIGKTPAALGKAADLWEGEGSIKLLSFIAH
ncbi:MAG: hypothetical protein Q8Q36_02730 [bacterium]|nr:hypothetical protein [bacterium]